MVVRSFGRRQTTAAEVPRALVAVARAAAYNGGGFSSTSERSPPYPLNNNKNLGDGGDQREKLEI